MSRKKDIMPGSTVAYWCSDVRTSRTLLWLSLSLLIIFVVDPFCLCFRHTLSPRLCLLEGGEDETDTQDPFSQLDDDGQLSDGEAVLGMDTPKGFRLQMSPPPALDQSLVNVWCLGDWDWVGSARSSRVEHTRVLGVSMITVPCSMLMMEEQKA